MIKNDIAAKIISELSIDISQKLNKSILQVRKHCDDEEYNAYRLAAAKVLGEILFEIMNPLYDEKPELKPDGFE